MDLVYELFRDYGLWILLPLVFFGQMGVPVGSMFFLAWYGSTLFSLEVFWLTVALVIGFTSLGDLTAYGIGRYYSESLERFASKRWRINKQLKRSRFLIAKYGSVMIFFSRFLITGLGPMVNYLVGGDRYRTRPFLFWVITGEALYALECLSLGYLLKDTWEYILVMVSDFGWIVLLVLIALLLVQMLIRRSRHAS